MIHWLKSAGRPAQSRLSRWRSMAVGILENSKSLTSLSDAELLRRAGEVRWRAKTNVSLRRLLPEAFELVAGHAIDLL